MSAAAIGENHRPVSSTHADQHTWCSGCGRPTVDPLTGLSDRWGWTQQASAVLHRADFARRPVALLIADVDRFKQVNDRLGHPAGDAVLAAVADVLRMVTHGGDLLCRYGSYGGDEFVALLPNADRNAALTVARRLQDGVAELVVQVPTATGRREVGGLSISVGVAVHGPGQSTETLMAQADAAMLETKRARRGAAAEVLPMPRRDR